MKPVKITTEYITLGQFLKWINLSSSGGETKMILETVQINVNGELENRRGKKLYPKDEVLIQNVGAFVIVQNDD
ncbi:MAG: S4 domain-containing protein YaaA [Candidatus Izemoplasmataceae bacterium]